MNTADTVSSLLLLFPGYYLYVDSSSRPPGQLARITTEKFTNTQGTYCFSFWYHMHGANVGSLTIYLNDNGKYNVFTRTGDQVNLWLYQTIQVSPQNAQFWVRLLHQFYIGVVYRNDIMIGW